MTSRSPTEYGNGDIRHAAIQISKDASEDIYVGLDSSTPCWNDASKRFYFN